MKQLLLTIMFLPINNAYALTDCPSDQSLRFHNCFGAYTFADGEKYVGEWQDDKRHGQGTYTFANGTIERGYYMNNEYVPDICEGMGITKGTEAFGNCVVELIKKL